MNREEQRFSGSSQPLQYTQELLSKQIQTTFKIYKNGGIKNIIWVTWRIMMTSPGSTPGIWSPSPWKVMRCSSLIPLSTATSSSLVCCTTLRPKHVWQRSRSLITSPERNMFIKNKNNSGSYTILWDAMSNKMHEKIFIRNQPGDS